MPGYVKYNFHQFNHVKPKNPHHQPYPAQESMYGADAQNMKPIDTSLELFAERVKQIKLIIGKLLYSTHGV